MITLKSAYLTLNNNQLIMLYLNTKSLIGNPRHQLFWSGWRIVTQVKTFIIKKKIWYKVYLKLRNKYKFPFNNVEKLEKKI
jgi:hypothetical protein